MKWSTSACLVRSRQVFMAASAQAASLLHSVLLLTIRTEILLSVLRSQQSIAAMQNSSTFTFESSSSFNESIMSTFSSGKQLQCDSLSLVPLAGFTTVCPCVPAALAGPC
eukprot:GABU01008930.1.p2 GENE.GABU01008930.1~~GABU01008930.1.p2  ORF type:complete len:110 (+),score=2.86 GABU01008930.1:180-509(+)